MRYLPVIVVLMANVLGSDCFYALPNSATCLAETTHNKARPEQIQQLIRRLGARRYATRQRAEEQLRHLGPEAIDQLLEAQYDSTHEISLAAQQILNSLTVNWSRPDEHPIVGKILQNYDDLSADQRIGRASWLAKLEDGFGFPAVLRIVRYDQSDVIAKQAALSLIESLDLEQSDQTEMLSKVMQELPRAGRAPLRWLRAFQADVLAHTQFELDDGNRAAIERLKTWHELAKREKSLTDSPRSTTSICEAINKQVAKLAIKLMQESDDVDGPDPQVSAIAEDALDYLVESNKESPASIIELGRWLIDTKQLALLEDKIWEPFQELRESQPQFTYLGAEAFAGVDAARSQQLADEAFNIYRQPPNVQQQNDDLPVEGKPDDDELAEGVDYIDPLVAVFAQINTAIALENRGLTEWAVREYRRIMENDSELWRISIIREQATIILSELLHDRGRDEEAADVLATIADKQGANNVFGNDDLNEEVSVVSRMHYFRSEHYRKEADREKQIEYLRKAVQADSTDADVLIAMHRLPRADDKWKSDTKRLIAKAVRGFEAKIQRQKAAGEIQNRADVAKNLNQVAWLVGNTEGDLKRAVEQSRRSLELRPASPGSLDTLGRTYFAVGDLENALKYQRRAAKLEPHSQQIARQLAEFETLASQRASGVPRSTPSANERGVTP